MNFPPPKMDGIIFPVCLELWSVPLHVTWAATVSTLMQPRPGRSLRPVSTVSTMTRPDDIGRPWISASILVHVKGSVVPAHAAVHGSTTLMSMSSKSRTLRVTTAMLQGRTAPRSCSPPVQRDVRRNGAWQRHPRMRAPLRYREGQQPVFESVAKHRLDVRDRVIFRRPPAGRVKAP